SASCTTSPLRRRALLTGKWTISTVGLLSVVHNVAELSRLMQRKELDGFGKHLLVYRDRFLEQEERKRIEEAVHDPHVILLSSQQ
nr:hypothetical protein [Gemmatimonadaceae bacterium]